MGLFDRGVQMLLTTVGAFAAFSLMTIAVGTDYWLYSRGVCKSKSMNENETSKKNEEVMTHSGLWRTCCLEAFTPRLFLRSSSGVINRKLRWYDSRRNFKGMCKQIDHFPEETDYEADPSEYFLPPTTRLFSSAILSEFSYISHWPAPVLARHLRRSLALEPTTPRQSKFRCSNLSVGHPG
ncbi:Voltage-dependent calcium channel gamma-2 subunit [Nibea albiflora]|uniref:Voltage-dependent calcium channel gamma-2 subunit n=1 Tax=Nibea albiflora TaxID=240163 RepID=A0ACB7EW58_NIBAL|nr:Voltage-dependent calcium channel gamma-2 subunit [Nibea albiflora]